MRGIICHAFILCVAACEPTIGDDPLAPSDEDDPTYEPLLAWTPDPDLDSDISPCDPGEDDCDALGEDDVEAVEGALVPTGVLAATRRTWPNGIIPYVIDDSVDRTTRSTLLKAMTNWTVQTENRIRFRAKRGSDNTYLRVIAGPQSMVRGGTGYDAGVVKTMVLEHYERITVVKHELGHVIGFEHEQKRGDRGAYIDVHGGNIVDSALCRAQFAVGGYVRPVAYDRVSVMHYRTTDLPNCRKGAVLTRNDGSWIQHTWKLSRKDLDAVAKLYDAGPTCRAETTAQLCTRKGKECGSLTATDNCGSQRTVNCGACAAPTTTTTTTTTTTSPAPELAAWLESLEENGSMSTHGLCATVSGASTADGTPIASTSCQDGDDQDWRATRDGQLKTKHSLGCAEVEGKSVVGATIVQRACNADEYAQKWKFRDMEVVNGKTGECLTIPNARYVVGQQVEIAACTGESKQKFTYRPATEELVAGSLCLTPTGGAVTTAPVVLAECDGRTSQHWLQARGGWVNRADTSQCMHVAGGAPTSGPIELFDCNDFTGQRWALRGAVRDSREQLCVQAGEMAGEPMKLAACDRSERQTWTFWSR